MFINKIYRSIFNEFFIFSIINILWLKYIKKISFVSMYYKRNELIWLDGFLFDFLQKKSVDIWLRRFIIYTGFLFSERLVFDCVVRLYIDNLIFQFHKFSIFEVSNTSEMLSLIIFLFSTIFFFNSFFLLNVLM
jgi:hypothetical protein